MPRHGKSCLCEVVEGSKVLVTQHAVLEYWRGDTELLQTNHNNKRLKLFIDINACLKISVSQSILLHPSYCSSICDIQNQNISCSDFGQFIHNRCDFLLLHHGADSQPSFFFQSIDSWGPLSWCDLCCRCQLFPANVILAEDILLSG